MAAGAAPAPERKTETKTEALEAVKARPVTLKQRIERLLFEIFEGHEDQAGWHQ